MKPWKQEASFGASVGSSTSATLRVQIEAEDRARECLRDAAPALLAALEDMTALAQDFIASCGPCDHDVNICICYEKRRIESARAAIKQARGES